MEVPVEVDVVVAGSGAAGLTAAWTAARAGLKVLLVEKTRWIGGTTAFSGGAYWIPNNPAQARQGLADDPDAARAYLRDMLGNDYDTDRIEAFLTTGPQVVRLLEEEGALASHTFATPDYEPWRPGAAFGRSMSPLPYDARRLGTRRRAIRPPLIQMTLFGGMQIDFADVGDYLALRHSAGAVWRAGKRFVAYLRDRVFHGRATRLTNGNALVGRLLESAIAAGVTIWTEAAVDGLDRESGRVTGVRLRHDGRNVQVRARHGVILATGGYGGNDAMRAQHMPFGARGLSLQPRDNVGDGIRIGEAAGGVFMTDNRANGIWYPMSQRPGPDGRPIGFSHLMDRQKPGFLIVGPDGRRFVNEGLSYQAFGNIMHARGIEHGWLIGGQDAVRKWGIGMAMPFPFPIGGHLRSGYVQRANTPEALAALIEVDAIALAATVARFDAHAACGEDPDFHRGEDAYTRALGDPAHAPNPAIGPLGAGPYYAVRLHQGELSTINGLRTDASARVLDREGQPVPGLYAAGVDANTLFRGHYPGGGCSLGPAMTFGFIAARHIAENAGAAA